MRVYISANRLKLKDNFFLFFLSYVKKQKLNRVVSIIHRSGVRRERENDTLCMQEKMEHTDNSKKVGWDTISSIFEETNRTK